MKKLFLYILLLAVFFCFAGSTYGQSEQVVKEEKIKVGFHCPHGKSFVEKGLKSAAGVVDAFADLETKIVTIKYIQGETNREELFKLIEEMGYATEDLKTSEFINKDGLNKQAENN